MPKSKGPILTTRLKKRSRIYPSTQAKKERCIKLGKKYGVEYDFVQFDNVKREL